MSRFVLLAISLPLMATGCGALTQGGACLVAEAHRSITGPNGEPLPLPPTPMAPAKGAAVQPGSVTIGEVDVSLKVPPGTNLTLCVW